MVEVAGAGEVQEEEEEVTEVAPEGSIPEEAVAVVVIGAAAGTEVAAAAIKVDITQAGEAPIGLEVATEKTIPTVVIPLATPIHKTAMVLVAEPAPTTTRIPAPRGIAADLLLHVAGTTVT